MTYESGFLTSRDCFDLHLESQEYCCRRIDLQTNVEASVAARGRELAEGCLKMGLDPPRNNWGMAFRKSRLL